MKNYTGQSVYMGIDVHKKTYSITSIHLNQVIKRDTINACPKELVRYCHKYFPGATVFTAYEAGFCGFYLHRELISADIRSIVVHAASIEIASRDRVKTDKRDSLKIATQLAAGRLKGIHIPSIEKEAMRSITRLREKFVRDRTRIGVQIKSFLNLHGLSTYKENRKVTKKWILELSLLLEDSEYSYCLKSMAKRWLHIDMEIKSLEVRLKQQASSELEIEKIYRSGPGIGPIASRILANELGDMSQFKSEKSAFSYSGLTPQEYSSGEHIRQGHISRQGKPILRKLLVQAAWTAIKVDQSLNDVFERISLKAGKKRAIIGVARRLLGHLRSCLGKKEKYRIAERVNN